MGSARSVPYDLLFSLQDVEHRFDCGVGQLLPNQRPDLGHGTFAPVLNQMIWTNVVPGA